MNRKHLSLEWNTSADGWTRSGWRYGSRAAFTRDWRGGAGFINGASKRARLVDTRTGEVVWKHEPA